MTLTEQWEKGELEWGKNYYCRNTKTNETNICFLYGHTWYSADSYGDGDIDWQGSLEVLAPVPSYEEWKELKDEVEIYHNNFKLMKAELERELENQQLKKLLKECKGFFVEGTKCDLVSYHKNDLFMMLKKIDNAIGEKK